MKLSKLVKHILFKTEYDKGLGRAKKLCLALSKLLNKGVKIDEWEKNVQSLTSNNEINMRTNLKF